jgi:hypothetical protein
VVYKPTDKQQELIDAYRSGKYRVFALGGGTGCVAANTRVFNPKKNKYIKIKNYKSGDYVRAYDSTKNTFIDVPCEVPGVAGEAKLFKVTTTRGFSIICTEEHKFMHSHTLAWRTVGEIMRNAKGSYNEYNSRILTYYKEDQLIVDWIKDIKYHSTDYFYDLHVPKYNNYLAQGFLNHNSAKTIGILNLLHVICLAVPNVRFPVFRKSEKNLKNNTIPSYKKILQWTGHDIPIVDLTARYPNGSELLFLWADATKDPDYDNIKGGEYTGCYFNEANQIDQGYFELSKTRVGRWNDIVVNKQSVRIKPSIFLDFNPTDNWVKQIFYDKDRDGKLPSDVFFQLSLPKDNPYLSEDVMAMLESLPEAEYNRYVLGMWDYGDDPQQLIQYIWLKNNFSDDVPTTGVLRLGVDVARYGDDSTVFAYMRGEALYKFEEFKKIDTNETAQLVALRMKELGIQQQNIVVDVVGLGAGVVDSLRAMGIACISYNSGDKPSTQTDMFSFYNMRAESHWYFREDLRLDKISVPDIPLFVAEATTNRYNIDTKVIRIEAKDDIKKRLKRSPNYLDAAVMVNYIRHVNSFDKDIDLDKYKTTKQVWDIYDDNTNIKEMLRW